MTTLPTFTKPVLIYVPCYNCAGSAAQVIRQIPRAFDQVAEVLLVDNCSDDDTGPVVSLQLRDVPATLPVQIIRTRRNLGYSGSQKLAYQIALANPAVETVIMLHGDGQYPPELCDQFLPLAQKGFDLVYGYRSKTRYPTQEETPWLTFTIIRLLSILESLVTRIFRKEWHTGFNMYSTRYLRRVPFQLITETPHIDGHLLYAASRLSAKVVGLPIFKRYKNLKAFDGDERLHYVLNVFRLMFRFQRIDLKAEAPRSLFSPDDYSVIP